MKPQKAIGITSDEVLPPIYYSSKDSIRAASRLDFALPDANSASLCLSGKLRFYVIQDWTAHGQSLLSVLGLHVAKAFPHHLGHALMHHLLHLTALHGAHARAHHLWTSFPSFPLAFTATHHLAHHILFLPFAHSAHHELHHFLHHVHFHFLISSHPFTQVMRKGSYFLIFPIYLKAHGILPTALLLWLSCSPTECSARLLLNNNALRDYTWKGRFFDDNVIVMSTLNIVSYCLHPAQERVRSKMTKYLFCGKSRLF